jgi:hypothetical protein
VELCSGELMYNIEEGIIGKNEKSIQAVEKYLPV